MTSPSPEDSRIPAQQPERDPQPQLHAVPGPVPAPARRRTGNAPDSPATVGAPDLDWLLAVQDLVGDVAAVEAVEAAVKGVPHALPTGRHELVQPARTATPGAVALGPSRRIERVPAERNRARQAARLASIPPAPDAALLGDAHGGGEEPAGRWRPKGQDLALALLAVAVLVAVVLVLTGSPS